MLGLRFTRYVDDSEQKTPFERLLEIFLELMVHTSGEIDEALDWLRELDDEHGLTDDDYTIEDFIEDLKSKGYIDDGDGDGEGNGSGKRRMTAKSEQAIRQRSLDQIFGKLKKAGRGEHAGKKLGRGDEMTSDRREFRFGDKVEQIAFSDSLRNAYRNHGIDDLRLSEGDLEIMETEMKTRTSTVLMIDISHSMILYGEDRITPAKKVAMALAELIKTKYPNDTLDIVVFGNDAWEVQVKDLPYLKVGPYHTNTVAGLELAMDKLRKRKNPNRQIFMITDGKPSCIKEFGDYYMNSFGLDDRIVNKTLNMARQCKKAQIPITTFMIAQDPYLQRFIERFTEANNGKAFYTSLKGLGEFIFHDFEKNRKKRSN